MLTDVEVDPERGIAYFVPMNDERAVVQKVTFDGTVHAELETSQRFAHLKLSPDRSKLLMWGNTTNLMPGPIAILDLSTGVEHPLGVEGQHAIWPSNDEIFFVRNENELWRFSLADRRAECAFRVDTDRDMSNGSYAKARRSHRAAGTSPERSRAGEPIQTARAIAAYRLLSPIGGAGMDDSSGALALPYFLTGRTRREPNPPTQPLRAGDGTLLRPSAGRVEVSDLVDEPILARFEVNRELSDLFAERERVHRLIRSICSVIK